MLMLHISETCMSYYQWHASRKQMPHSIQPKKLQLFFSCTKAVQLATKCKTTEITLAVQKILLFFYGTTINPFTILHFHSLNRQLFSPSSKLFQSLLFSDNVYAYCHYCPLLCLVLLVASHRLYIQKIHFYI